MLLGYSLNLHLILSLPHGSLLHPLLLLVVTATTLLFLLTLSFTLKRKEGREEGKKGGEKGKREEREKNTRYYLFPGSKIFWFSTCGPACPYSILQTPASLTAHRAIVPKTIEADPPTLPLTTRQKERGGGGCGKREAHKAQILNMLQI